MALLHAGQADAAFALLQRGVAAGFVVGGAENFIGPLVQRGDRLSALLLMDSLDLSPAPRDQIMDALSRPGNVGPDSAAVVRAYVNDPRISKQIVSHMYLWFGDFNGVGTTEDGVTGEIVAWDHYPPGFRDSSGFKRKLERSGALGYWRRHGFPPQCRPVGREDFNCD